MSNPIHPRVASKWHVLTNDQGRWHCVDGPVTLDRHMKPIWYVNGIQANTPIAFQELSGCSDEELLALVLKFGPMERTKYEDL